jgi:hypothetical protein
MKILNIPAEFMTKRSENLHPGWWIVDVANDSFFDGIYPTKEAALESAYHRICRTAGRSM